MDHVRELARKEDRPMAAMVRRLVQLAIEGREIPKLDESEPPADAARGSGRR
jgi:hypothetical protein